MKHKMFASFILTLLLAPLANSCDADDCKIGTSVGSAVCQVGAAVGGAAVAATTCVAGAAFTFGLSCVVAGAAYVGLGAGCAVAGTVVESGGICDLCASDDAPNLKEIANKVDGIEQTLVENHLEQEAWFNQLVENDKNIILGQAKMITLQQTTMGQLSQLINTTETLGDRILHSQTIALYGQAFHHVTNVRRKFELLTRGPSDLIVNDHRAEKFRDAALRHNTRSEDSNNNIFKMLIGGHPLKKESIYETPGGKFCKPEIHKYFVDVLVEGLMMHATALVMEGHTLSPQFTKKFNEDLVKATSAYNRHCDCGAGYIKANRGQVSTILDKLPSSSQNLNQNRGRVARMENRVMRIKMDLLFAVKNFEPNKIAETILENHSVEDIELVVASVMNKKEDDLEHHDSADICVDKERNKVKTCAAFTPDSFVTGCVPPQTLDHGRFLCLEDGVTCHVVCDKCYYQRLPQQTFMECLDNAWTPLPTSFKCEVISDLNPTVESSKDYGLDYRGSLLLENSCEGNNPSNYWLSPDGKTGEEASIILNLGRVARFNRFNIKNTHNGESNDRGAKNIGLYTSNSKDGPWKLVAVKLMADARNKGCNVPVEKVTIGTTDAQFIKLVINSYYGRGGGLQYLGVDLSGGRCGPTDAEPHVRKEGRRHASTGHAAVVEPQLSRPPLDETWSCARTRISQHVRRTLSPCAPPDGTSAPQNSSTTGTTAGTTTGRRPTLASLLEPSTVEEVLALLFIYTAVILC